MTLSSSSLNIPDHIKLTDIHETYQSEGIQSLDTVILKFDL